MAVHLILIGFLSAFTQVVLPLDCLDVPEFGLPRRRVALLFRAPAAGTIGLAAAVGVEAMVHAPLNARCVLYDVHGGNATVVSRVHHTVVSLPAYGHYTHPLDVVGALAARGECEVVAHSRGRTLAAVLQDPHAVLVGSPKGLAALAAPYDKPCVLRVRFAPPLVESTVARDAGEEPTAAARPLDCSRLIDGGARRRVALAFFGINRSLRLTIESLRTHLFARLRADCVPYDVYLHTFTDALVDNPRSNERNVRLPGSAEMIQLLKPVRFALSSSAEADHAMPIARFTARGLAYPKITTRNLLRQYYSLSRVTALWAERRSEYAAVAYVRPDLMLVRPLDVVAMLSSQPREVVVPYWHAWGGLNDRLAFGHPDAMLVWGGRGEYAAEFARARPLHAEQLLLWVVTQRRNLTLRYTSLLGLRVRATGAIQDACLPHQCRAASKRCLGVCSRTHPDGDCFGCRGVSVDPACHADHRACGKGALATSRCLLRADGAASLPARRAKKGEAVRRVEVCEPGSIARLFQTQSSDDPPAGERGGSGLDQLERPPKCLPMHVPLSDLRSHGARAPRPHACVTRHPALRALDEYKWVLGACSARRLSAVECQATLGAREAEPCAPLPFLSWLKRSLSAARFNLFHARCHFIPQTRFLSAACGRPTIGADASVHGCDALIRAEDLHSITQLSIERPLATLNASAGKAPAIVVLCAGRALRGAAGQMAFARALGLDAANTSLGSAVRPEGAARRSQCALGWDQLPKGVKSDVARRVHEHYRRDYELLGYVLLPPSSSDEAAGVWTPRAV